MLAAVRNIGRLNSRRWAFWRLSCMGLILAPAVAAQAASFQVLGETFEFDSPAGYCVGGESSPRERELVLQSRKALANAKLVAWLTPCNELKELRAGLRDSLDHWMQLQVAMPRGELRKMGLSRTLYVDRLTGSLTRSRSEALDKRMKERLTQIGVSVETAEVEIVEHDGNAAYLSTRSKIDSGGVVKNIRGLGAGTLINQVPIYVFSYESSGSNASLDRAHSAMKSLLQSLLINN